MKLIFESYQDTAETIRQAIRRGDVSGLHAKVLMRDVGATQAIIVINGIKFVIDDSSRLKYANISTDYSQKVSSQYYPGIKNDRDLINLYKTLPHLGLSDFTRIILKRFNRNRLIEIL